MKLKILEFIDLLRDAGLKITPVETIDCLTAVNLLGYDKEMFYNSLQATLVKEKRDLNVFDKLFKLYFTKNIMGENQIYDDYDENDNIFLGKDRAGIADGRGLASGGAGGPTPDLLQAVLSKDSNPIKSYFRVVLDKIDNLLGIDVDMIVRNTQIDLEWFMVLSKIEILYEKKEISINQFQEHIKFLNELKEDLKNMVEEKQILQHGKKALKNIAKRENLFKVNFVDLNKNQVEELEGRILQLGRKLATKKSYRLQKAKSGRVNIRDVVRKSLPYGGVPIKLSYLNKKISRPSLVMLCDISGSVAQFSRFMLQLIYLSQKTFKDVQLFVFVDHLVEITDLFRNYHFDEVLAELPYLTKVTETGYSHFGNTFKEFYEGYINILNDKTTFIVLGDARNNWRPSGKEYLALIKEKSHRVYWLNPQPIEQWNQRDSIIDSYKKYCDEVFECRNMEQLEKVVKKIF